MIAHMPTGAGKNGETRPGAGSRSAQDSTTSPTADLLAARDGDRPSALRVLAPTRRPVERSAHRGDPAHTGEALRWRPASPPSGGWHASPRATAQSWPDKPHPDHGSTRYAPTHGRSSMHNDQCGDRSPAPPHPAHRRWRSLPLRQTTDNGPTPPPERSAACHQAGGTISIQPPVTPQPRPLRTRTVDKTRLNSA